MLRFNAIVCNMIAIRFIPRLYSHSSALFTTSPALLAEQSVNAAQLKKQPKVKLPDITVSVKECKNFNELKSIVYNCMKDEQSVSLDIKDIKNVEELLNLLLRQSSGKNISHVMSAITQWTNINNTTVKTMDSKDPIKLPPKNNVITVMESELNDPELRNYVDLNTFGMIKQITLMGTTGERNLKVFNFLCKNINEYATNISVTQCTDLLYAMYNLHCMDELLLDKISVHLRHKNPPIERLARAVKSMALLRYKNEAFLQYACEVSCSVALKSTKEIQTILVSFAILNFKSNMLPTLIQKYMSVVSFDKMTNTDRLTLIWSLVILNYMDSSIISTILGDQFVETLISANSKISNSIALKLLNVNGVARWLIKDYSGPFLNESLLPKVVLNRSNQKETCLSTIKEALKIVLRSSSFTTDINTKMGFFLDAECHLPTNFIKNPKFKTDNAKVALMVRDKYDYCLNSDEFTGLCTLQTTLLERSGYRVINISYKNVNGTDKITKHVEFLKRRFLECYSE